MMMGGYRVAGQRPMADQLWAMTRLSAALALVALAAMALDTRMLDGALVWAKPLKFAASFILYFATLALVLDRLSAPVRQSRWVAVWTGAAVVSMLGEMGYMLLMAGQGERSHFNTSAPIYEALYNLMGFGALTLMLAVGALGWALWRDRGARVGDGLRAGVALGFPGSAVLTVIVGFTLGGNGGHFVGVPQVGAPVLPVFGWSASVGDLRPAHFLALHAMQAIPLAGLAADRLGAGPRWVVAALLVYAAVTIAVFVQALMGLPLIAL